jgi:hypothetical protein
MGAKLVDGLACRKPKPVVISRRHRTHAPVIDLQNQAMCYNAASGETPMGTASTTPNSPRNRS